MIKTLIGFATLALASCGASAPAFAQDIPVRTVYEDMRLVCGTENSNAYRTRVLTESRQVRRDLERRGFNVLVVRLNSFDAAPAGAPVRTRADCQN